MRQPSGALAISPTIASVCTLRTNLWTTKKEDETDFWGITMRQSNYGLELLGTIVDTKLKETYFAMLNVADALEVIKALWRKFGRPIAAVLRRT